MERLLGGSNDTPGLPGYYTPLTPRVNVEDTHLEIYLRLPAYRINVTLLLSLLLFFCLLDDRLIGGSGLLPADFIWVSLMVTLLASMATKLAAAAYVWLLYMHPLCCIIHLLCWLCLMLSFDSVEQCVCERETQRTMTASEEKKNLCQCITMALSPGDQLPQTKFINMP